jgi:hypothetical protein
VPRRVLEHPRGRTKEDPLASADPTARLVTIQCELGNCRRCRGQGISLLAPAGQPCQHDCHTPEPDPLPEVA